MLMIYSHVDIHLHFTVLCILIYSFIQWFIACYCNTGGLGKAGGGGGGGGGACSLVGKKVKSPLRQKSKFLH